MSSFRYLWLLFHSVEDVRKKAALFGDGGLNLSTVLPGENMEPTPLFLLLEDSIQVYYRASCMNWVSRGTTRFRFPASLA